MKSWHLVCRREDVSFKDCINNKKNGIYFLLYFLFNSCQYIVYRRISSLVPTEGTRRQRYSLHISLVVLVWLRHMFWFLIPYLNSERSSRIVTDKTPLDHLRGIRQVDFRIGKRGWRKRGWFQFARHGASDVLPNDFLGELKEDKDSVSRSHAFICSHFYYYSCF